MANIWQVTYGWTGLVGMPGFTNLFYSAATGDGTEALAAVTKAKVLFDGIAAWVPSPCVMSPLTDVRLLDDATGDLLDIFTVTGVASSTAAATAEHAAASGACIDWLTTTVHGTRRLQGRTYVVPLSTLAYQADGSIGTTPLLQIATAAEAMRTHAGPTFGVWGRPRKARVGPPVVTARAGLWGAAVSSRVPDLAAQLRSRRD